MKPTEQKKKLQYPKRITGIQKNLANVPSLVLNKTTLTPAQLIAMYQGWLNLSDAADAKHNEYVAALQVRDAAGQALAPIDRSLRRYFEGAYGEDCQQLKDCAFDPRKTPAKTAQVKAEAVVKAKATRVARGTRGKKQKKSIKGQPAPATPAK